jgi:MFS family permease
MSQLTMAWLMLQMTDSAAWVSLAVFAYGLPSFVLTLPAGALADRWDRRKQMLASQSVALVNALTLATVVAADHITPGIALFFALVGGSTNAMAQPARQAMIPQIVPPQHLMNAIVLGSMSQSLSQLVGPALAGLLIATVSIAASFYALSVLLVVGIGALVLLRLPERADSASRRPFRPSELLGGIGFLRSSKPLLTVALLYLATGIFIVGPISTLVPVIVRDYYHVGADKLGIAYTAQAIGAIGSSLWITRMSGVPNKGGLFAASMMLGASGLIGYGLSPSYEVSLIFFFVFGCATAFYTNMSQTLLQKHAPPEVLGRVLSIVTLSIAGFIPLGALQAGLVASAFDARVAAVYGGVVGLTLAISAAVFHKGFRRLE